MAAAASGVCVIRGGLVMDGTGRRPAVADVAMRAGRIEAIAPRIEAGEGARVVDASGRWVAPGLLDIHTHYDAELEVAPGLLESVRHGVTTVVIGNCSLGLSLGEPEELLDIFTRVENMPRAVMRGWLAERVGRWDGVAGYLDHLAREVALGPNVAAFLGHSNVRLAAMGLARSLRAPRAGRDERARMERLVAEGMEAGYVGLSIDMLPWHRMDGAAHRGVSIPSQQAHPSEPARLARAVRARGRVLQATPNAVARASIFRLIGLSCGAGGRRPLRTTIVAALDVDGFPGAFRFLTALATTANRLLGADVRFQALAAPFRIFSDGAVNPLFEELEAGVELLGRTPEERRRLFADAVFRDRFAREWCAPVGPFGDGGVFHRRLDRMWVVAAPDPALVGRSFAAIAAERGASPLEAFMDLLAEHGDAIRWVTEVANGRRGPRRHLLAHPTTLPGFNDSGAHARNLGYQDGGLQLLREARADPGWMRPARAVARLTAEPARWLGIDAGELRVGARADVIVIDPASLDAATGDPVEQRPPFLEGAMRMVRPDTGAIRHVFINGAEAFTPEGPTPTLGQIPLGHLLRTKP